MIKTPDKFPPPGGIVKLTEDTGFPEVFLDNPIPKYKGLEC